MGERECSECGWQVSINATDQRDQQYARLDSGPHMRDGAPAHVAVKARVRVRTLARACVERRLGGGWAVRALNASQRSTRFSSAWRSVRSQSATRSFLMSPCTTGR